MASHPLFFDGQKFISTKEASRLTGYTSDYIGQISRAGKVESRMVGRTRFVEEKSLMRYHQDPAGVHPPLPEPTPVVVETPPPSETTHDFAHDDVPVTTEERRYIRPSLPIGQKIAHAMLAMVIFFGGFVYAQHPEYITPIARDLATSSQHLALYVSSSTTYDAAEGVTLPSDSPSAFAAAFSSITDTMRTFFAGLWNSDASQMVVAGTTSSATATASSIVRPSFPAVTTLPVTTPLTPVYVPMAQPTHNGVTLRDLAIAMVVLRNELAPRIDLAMLRPRAGDSSSSRRSSGGGSDIDQADLDDYLLLSGGTLTGDLAGTDATFTGDLIASTLALTGSTTLNGTEYGWPSADGSDGDVLTTNGDGVLSWGTIAAGVSFSTTSADYYIDASSTIAHASGIADGNVLQWNGSAWVSVATSTLGIAGTPDGAFATTSADYWKTQNNFFSTTSADYLTTQRNFYSTTSADYWLTVRNFFSTTSADYLATQRNFFSTSSANNFVNSSTTIANASGVTSGNVLQWNGSKWISVATTTLGTQRPEDYINASTTLAHAGNASFGNVMTWNGSSWQAAATSTFKINTDDTVEGSSKLYYTDARVANYLNGSTTLSSSINYWTLSGSDVYRASGNVGIGTTSPYATFSLQDTSGGTDIATFVGAGGYTTIDQYGNFYAGGVNPTAGMLGTGVVSLRIANTGGKDWRIENTRTSTAGTLEFTNVTDAIGSPRMVITAAGNVGIGTTTPQATLSVSGTTAFTATTSTAIPLSINAASGQSANLFNITSSGGTAGDRFSINSNGNILTLGSGQLRFGYNYGNTWELINALSASDVTLGSSGRLLWGTNGDTTNSDSGLSRVSAGVIGVGTGAQGSTAGAIQANEFRLPAYDGSYNRAISGSDGYSIRLDTTPASFGGLAVYTANGVTSLLRGSRLTFTPSGVTDGVSGTDLALSRVSAGVLALGTGAQGSMAGTLLANTIGIGTSSPFAKLSVHANNADGLQNLFVIASSTASATTTLFSISNAGAVTTTGPILVANGTAASPAITFSGDNGGTGFFAMGGTNVAASANGAAVWRFTDNEFQLRNTYTMGWEAGAVGGGSNDTAFSRLSAGKIGVGTGVAGSVAGTLIANTIGVGTSSPFAKLSVHATANDGLSTLFTVSTSTLTATTTVFSIDRMGTTTVSGGLKIANLLYDGSASGGVNGYVLKSTGTGVQWVATSSLNIAGSGGASQWTTSGSNIYYATASGNVGVGSTSPIAKFSVLGDGGQTDALYVQAGSGTTAISSQAGNAGGIRLYAGTGGLSSAEGNDADGGVGGGLIFAAGNGGLANDAIGGAYVANGGAGGSVTINAGNGGDGTNGAFNQGGSGGSVTISAGASGSGSDGSGSAGNVLLLTSGGRIGLGTSTPWRSLSVAGTVNLSSSLSAEAGSDNYLCIDPITYEVTNGGANCGASSARFKENIVDLTYGLDEIKALRPVTFTYKKEINPDGSTHLGLIAEEVAQVVPEVVEYDDQGRPQSLSYDHLVALLIKGIQQLSERVDALATAAGANVIDGVVHIKTLVVGTFTVGSESEPSGITLYDEVTGEPYCLSIRNGASVTRPGACGTAATIVTPPAPQNEGPIDDTPPAATTTEPATVPDVATTTASEAPSTDPVSEETIESEQQSIETPDPVVSEEPVLETIATQ